MIKSNLGNLYTILWYFNKANSNEIYSREDNKTIQNCAKNVVVIDVHYKISLLFGLADYGKSQVFFRVTDVNGTSFDVDVASSIGHPAPMLTTVVIIIEGY